MDNMDIYKRVQSCPSNALRQIQAGRLKGKSDINPMWRIKMLTELFGACGIGWYYDITKQWLETGANGEISAFCNIALYIKVGDEWSKPIQGTGGSAFIAKEKNGLYTSDEAYKMALTDALSVACKALGIAADVYWNSDGQTKYDKQQNTGNQQTQQPPICKVCGKPIQGATDDSGVFRQPWEVQKMCNGACVSCYIAGKQK